MFISEMKDRRKTKQYFWKLSFDLVKTALQIVKFCESQTIFCLGLTNGGINWFKTLILDDVCFEWKFFLHIMQRTCQVKICQKNSAKRRNFHMLETFITNLYKLLCCMKVTATKAWRKNCNSKQNKNLEICS